MKLQKYLIMWFLPDGIDLIGLACSMFHASSIKECYLSGPRAHVFSVAPAFWKDVPVSPPPHELWLVPPCWHYEVPWRPGCSPRLWASYVFSPLVNCWWDLLGSQFPLLFCPSLILLFFIFIIWLLYCFGVLWAAQGCLESGSIKWNNIVNKWCVLLYTEMIFTHKQHTFLTATFFKTFQAEWQSMPQQLFTDSFS